MLEDETHTMPDCTIDNRILTDIHFQSKCRNSTICGCTKTSPSYVLHFKPRQLDRVASSE